MAVWADQGHAMRRRSGNPSSHTEAAGKSESREHETMEEQYAAHSAANSPRTSVGREEGAAHEAAESQGVEQAEDRRGVERHGAQYRVTAGVSGTVDPTVGPTIASGRIVPQFPGQTLNFETAVQYSQL